MSKCLNQPALLLVLLLCWSVLPACGGCESDAVDSPDSGTTMMDASGDLLTSDLAPATDEGTPDPVDEGAPVICTPGEITACRQENTQGVDVCNAEGTATEAGSCPPSQVCRQGACVQVACIPGARRCTNGADSPPERCDEAGAGYEELDACTGGATCELGFCLDRCELARRNSSYIGCEYWAVELENHLLYDEGLPEDRLPPFGIVLTNTSETYDALITIYDDGEVIAEAVGERIVGVDRSDPSLTLERVVSEVVDSTGRQLFTIEGPVENLVLPRGSLMTLIMPHKRIPFGESAVGKFGYKVVSSQPVVAYQFNPLCCNYNTTNDASLLIPESALTNDYMYLGYAVFAGSSQGRLEDPWSATLTVVATQDDTQVDVKLPFPKGQGRPYAGLIYPEKLGDKPESERRIIGPDTGGVLTVTLDAFEVLNLGGTGRSPVEDLTGARITSTKPVAVFSGHSCAYVPYTLGFCDHIESQLFPLETWGRRFVLAPLKRRNETDEVSSTREATYWKFLARQDDTRILLGMDISHGPQGTLRPADEGVPSCVDFSDDPTLGVVRLEQGQTCEFGTRNMLLAQSNNPISVGAFLSGQDSVFQNAEPGDRAGDPAFFLVPPEEQYRTSYTFLTPKTYFQNYVTITMQPGFGVELNGEMVRLEDHDFEALEDEGLVRAHIPLEEGPHRISALVPFGIVVYGYDDYVSYAYTGGLNLTKLSELPVP